MSGRRWDVGRATGNARLGAQRAGTLWRYRRVCLGRTSAGIHRATARIVSGLRYMNSTVVQFEAQPSRNSDLACEARIVSRLRCGVWAAFGDLCDRGSVYHKRLMMHEFSRDCLRESARAA